MFQAKVVEKIKTHIMPKNFSRKPCRLLKNVENMLLPDCPQVKKQKRRNVHAR